MEYDETFVCPRCKQDYSITQFRPIITTNFQNEHPEICYEVIFNCVNNACNGNIEQRKVLNAIEVRNLLCEGYNYLCNFWKKIGKEDK